jgi:oligoribonuclease
MAGSMQQPSGPWVWIDLEMTGLDVTRCVIIQAAVVVTGHDLVEKEALELDLCASEAELAVMDDFVRAMHTRSGLLDKVRASRVTVAEAEARMLELVERHSAPGTAVLCGNSVWMDRLFLARFAPRLVAHLHYRIVDVSSLKTLVRAWRPEAMYEKDEKAHTAMADIRESLAELRHYRAQLFGKA